MIRHDTPTARPTAPGCTCSDRGLCSHCQWAQSVDAPAYQPPRTVPMAPPDPVTAYVAKRAAIAALRAECDALWDAMTESEHDRVVTTLESLGLVG